MIGYVMLGANDLALAERFYTAFLPAMGYRMVRTEEGLRFDPPVTEGQPPGPDFHVVAPWDEQPASTGNGTMVAFALPDEPQVRALHAAALAAGGVDEGVPGFREAYGPNFYVGYLRDPQGNKIALYCTVPDTPGA